MKKFQLLILIGTVSIQSFSQSPNILLVIADDLGVDYTNGYHNSNLLPITPTLDSLRANGLTFMNTFSTAKCTPSRATIMSGKHGVKNGVPGTPGNLDTAHVSIFRAVEQETNGLYSDAVIGKWHISQPANPNHPYEHGADYYTGLLSSQVSDYYAWEHTHNGITAIDTNYVTTVLTDESIAWINTQNQPWFLWLAHVAPHGPFHVPPAALYNITATGTNARKYVAMIEAIDHELGRLFANIPSDERNNTVVIFIGDNGTPSNLLQNYPSGRGKGTIYQGGIHVPMIVCGQGVTRKGEKENALVHITDIYATVLELVGKDLPGGIYNSLSFKHLLDNSPGKTRDYNYSELAEATDEFTIRNKQYKLIESITNGTQQFYDLLNDSLEIDDLMLNGLSTDQINSKADLEVEADQRRNFWSCRDHIQNGNEVGIDCGGTYCQPCPVIGVNDHYTSKYDITIYPNPAQNELTISSELDNFRLELFTSWGQKILVVTSSENETSIDLSTLSSGVYITKVFDSKEELIFLDKLIKN